MSRMKDLYEKVAADRGLQTKINEIMNSAEKDGKEITEAKLTAFAKEAGYDVTIEEMTAFFQQISGEQQNGTLSDLDLDMVAGGKSNKGLAISIFSLGLGCAALSVTFEAGNGNCSEFFNQ